MIAEQVDLSKYIEMRNDRPHIRGRRLPIMTIINTQKATNYTVDELCYDYTLSRAQVLAALLYYQEHQEEMEQLETLDKQKEEELFARYARDDRK